MLKQLHPQAKRIARLLTGRREKIAVADGATGGLIAAAILTVPGALKFYVGGGIVYSFKARDVLFDLPRDAYEGMRSATEEYALLQARAIRDRMGTEWGIAESGSAGSSKHPMGVVSGRSVAAVVGPDCEVTATIETGSDDRIENMEKFTRNALDLLERALSKAP
ncbi:CinA family protein [Erythrobacter sp. THAF29]|uniref:CinA family protein n=1 Tax=Erythrobacter sp. THAF29 TaxID=2587851 RepID=UPI001269809B|nr:CinA family protein [Erythrobacter sp. THAF29]QFT78095.1 Putative competence-damage inducible protein [Erythrobacter sp. THAF29]